jgi:hypothetical protein
VRVGHRECRADEARQPSHIADLLEAEWNHKLRALVAAQEDYERKRADESGVLNAQQREQVMALVADFPRLWRDPATPHRERKRMVWLLLEDVTLTNLTR